MESPQIALRCRAPSPHPVPNPSQTQPPPAAGSQGAHPSGNRHANDQESLASGALHFEMPTSYGYLIDPPQNIKTARRGTT